MRVVLKGIASATKRLADGRRVKYYYAWRGGPRLDGEPGAPEFHAVQTRTATRTQILQDLATPSGRERSGSKVVSWRHVLHLVQRRNPDCRLNMYSSTERPAHLAIRFNDPWEVPAMGDTTRIEWADKTWSPWTGCTRVSPACEGCYAAHLMDTRMGRVEWGEPGIGEGTRDLMSDAYWRKPLAWNRAAAKTGERCWVFPSLCDPFDTAVEPRWRARFVELMEATPNLLWLLLTKRSGNILKLTDPMRGERMLPRNVALGTTVEDRARLRNLDWLLQAAATIEPAFTFMSGEPLLEDLGDLGQWLRPAAGGGLGWVIAGGKTDQGAHAARPMNPAWIRAIRDQCVAAGVPFHFKQWGEWAPMPDSYADARYSLPLRVWVDGAWTDCGGAEGEWLARVGKKAAGRLLDGIEHNAMPAPRP